MKLRRFLLRLWAEYVWTPVDPIPDRAHGGLTCTERADLLRRGRADCTVADHAACVADYGRMIGQRNYWRRQAGEYKQQLDQAVAQLEQQRAA